MTAHVIEETFHVSGDRPADPPFIEFRDRTDPEANGRVPQNGDVRYTLLFPLEDGTELRIHMGREGCAHVRKVVLDSFMDEQFEINAPSSRSRFHDARRLRLELTPLIGLQDAEVAAEIEAILQKALES